MALRGFGVQTSTSTAQPAFGTTLSAASVVNPDQYTGATDPRSNASQSLVTVTNPNIFFRGDRIGIGTAANFGFAGTITQAPDWGKVVNVNYSTSVVTVQGLQRAHASGEFAVLGTDCAVLTIEAITGGPFYIGPDSTVAAASVTLAYEILAASVTAGLGNLWQIGSSSDGNVHDTSGYWVSGTATFIPSIVTV